VASIREVAERSGVSIATVSRVLNGSPRVREDTRRRVLERADELGYVPSAAARTLVRQRSQLIGVVLDTGTGQPNLAHPFFHEVLVGLNESVGAHEYDLLFISNRRHAFLERALHHQVDGLALLSGPAPDHPDFVRLLESGPPTVALHLPTAGPRAAQITSDNAEGARLAVRHLRERGHEKIATIAGPEGHLASEERLAGYLDELGGRPRKRWIVRGDFYTTSGLEAARRLLALADPPTAVFAASDLMAFGALSAAREAGVSVPDDLAIVGFDDVPLAGALELTTVRQDKHGLGVAAGETLFSLIESPADTPRTVTLPVDLVVRGSS
jgi:LacI family transcriptional regulator